MGAVHSRVKVVCCVFMAIFPNSWLGQTMNLYVLLFPVQRLKRSSEIVTQCSFWMTRSQGNEKFENCNKKHVSKCLLYSSVRARLKIVFCRWCCSLQALTTNCLWKEAASLWLAKKLSLLTLLLLFRNKHLCGMFTEIRILYPNGTLRTRHFDKGKNDYHEWIFIWRGEPPLWVSASYWTRARLVDKPLQIKTSKNQVIFDSSVRNTQKETWIAFLTLILFASLIN